MDRFYNYKYSFVTFLKILKIFRLEIFKIKY